MEIETNMGIKMAAPIDMCITISSKVDALCFGALLHSLRTFGMLNIGLRLLVSVYGEDGCEDTLRNVCSEYGLEPQVDRLPPAMMDADPAWRHALSLNRLMSRVTSDLVVFSDPDVIVTSSKLWSYCVSALHGKLMVGMPYHDAQARVVWQGMFPTLWFAVVDGAALGALLSDGLDMLPGSSHLRPDCCKMTDEDWREYRLSVCGVEEPPPAEWAVRQGSKPVYVWDAGWELAARARKFGMGHARIEYYTGGYSRKNRRRGLQRRVLERAARVPCEKDECDFLAAKLRELSPLEYCFSGTDETCCLHLLHACTKPGRASAWLGVAKRIVDVCHRMETDSA